MTRPHIPTMLETLTGGEPTNPTELEQVRKQLEDAKDVIAFVGPGLLVLRNMLKTARLPLGEKKAQEMIRAVQDFLAGRTS